MLNRSILDMPNRAGLLRGGDEGLSLDTALPAARACSRALARENERCQQTRAIRRDAQAFRRTKRWQI